MRTNGGTLFPTNDHDHYPTSGISFRDYVAVELMKIQLNKRESPLTTMSSRDMTAYMRSIYRLAQEAAHVKEEFDEADESGV